MGAKHLIVVGGLVPPLLAPDPPAAHLGSADIDLCLSVAIVDGATREYYRSIAEQLEPWFALTPPSGFRWTKRTDAPGLAVTVDFLAPAAEHGEQRSDGSRPLDDETAARNAGTLLRPFPIRTGALIGRDAVATVVEGVELLYRPGVRADVRIRHAGPVGFLAAKADALDGRDDSKDGYDVAWWCLNAAARSADVAELVLARPAFADPLFLESIALLQRAFRAPDYPGPDGYARELYPHLEAGDEDYELARNAAFASVSELLEVLTPRLWDGSEAR
jgi:hypothetical protein